VGGVRCPLCGGRFRHFLPHRSRPDARCPGCGALERHRVLALWLDEHEVFAPGARILHMAPEPSLETALRRRPHARYVTADLYSEGVDVKADITALPFDDASFDVALCNHVLEHIPDDHKAMTELARVLVPGGRAVMMHPIDYGRTRTDEDPSVEDPAERLRRFGQEDHIRIYGADFRQRLESAGFEVRVDRYPERLGPAAIKRHGLLAHQRDDALPLMRADDIYLCTKPG
jgi:SAM-dependent methyltransferase